MRGKSLLMGMLIIIVPLMVLVGGVGIGMGSYWLMMKSQTRHFSLAPKPTYVEAVATWPLCWRCEYQPLR